jgi:hypothetical protein
VFTIKFVVGESGYRKFAEPLVAGRYLRPKKLIGTFVNNGRQADTESAHLRIAMAPGKILAALNQNVLNKILNICWLPSSSSLNPIAKDGDIQFDCS